MVVSQEPAEEELSLEELKKDLYSSLRSDGTVNSIKAHLRSRILNKLQNVSSPTTTDLSPVSSSPSVQTWTVEERIGGSLVVEYLEHFNMKHTLSVFLPESSLHTCIFSRKHILEALKLDPDSELHKRMMGIISNQSEAAPPYTDNNNNRTGKLPLVLLFIREICAMLGKNRITSGTQTISTAQDHRNMLDDQLRKVDEFFMDQSALQRGSPSMEERMLAYQRDCDSLAQQQIASEVQEFKDKKMDDIRREERRRYVGEINAVRANAKAEYRDKLQHVKDTEQQNEVQFLKRKSEMENELHRLQQSAISKLNDLRDREDEVNKNALREAKLSAERTAALDARENRVSEREALNTEIEETCRVRVQKGIERARVEILESFADREVDIASGERQLKTNQEALNLERAEFDLIAHKFTAMESSVASTTDENNSLKQSLLQSQNQMKALEQSLNETKELLSRKERALRLATENVPTLEAAVTSLETELRMLKERHCNTNKENAALLSKLGVAQERLHSLASEKSMIDTNTQSIVSKAVAAERTGFLEKENAWWEEKRGLTSQVDDYKAKAERLQRAVEDETITSDSLRHEVNSLREMLSDAQTAMSTMESFRTTNNFARSRSGFRNSYNNTAPASVVPDSPFYHEQQSPLILNQLVSSPPPSQNQRAVAGAERREQQRLDEEAAEDFRRKREKARREEEEEEARQCHEQKIRRMRQEEEEEQERIDRKKRRQQEEENAESERQHLLKQQQERFRQQLEEETRDKEARAKLAREKQLEVEKLELETEKLRLEEKRLEILKSQRASQAAADAILQEQKVQIIQGTPSDTAVEGNTKPMAEVPIETLEVASVQESDDDDSVVLEIEEPDTTPTTSTTTTTTAKAVISEEESKECVQEVEEVAEEKAPRKAVLDVQEEKEKKDKSVIDVYRQRAAARRAAAAQSATNHTRTMTHTRRRTGLTLSSSDEEVKGVISNESDSSDAISVGDNASESSDEDGGKGSSDDGFF